MIFTIKITMKKGITIVGFWQGFMKS